MGQSASLSAARRKLEQERVGARGGIVGALWDAVRSAREHQLMTTARALAFSLFFAIPSALLLVLGVFSLVASERDVERITRRLEAVMPSDVATVLGDSLERTMNSPRSGVAMVALGFVLAAWSTTSAATTLMQGVSAAFERTDARGFARRRLAALAIVACLLASMLLVLGLLILGPHLARWVGEATGEPSLTTWIWWSAQWPVLLGALLFAFAIVLYVGSDVEGRRWQVITPGAVVALVVWLAASGALAFYSASFGTFEKTLGTLSAVVVTLLWLWIGAASLLFGAELNAQLVRHRPRS